MRITRSRVAAIIATAGLCVGAAAAPAEAQTQQDGLVNVALTDNTLQVPVSVAANICDVSVAVLAQTVGDGGANCNAAGEAVAVDRNTGQGGNTRQNGLVNLAVTDNTIQIPIAIAANVCDVDVAILAVTLPGPGGTVCTAQARSTARRGGGNGNR